MDTWQGCDDLSLLELSPKGTYVMYPYPESLKARVPSHAHRYIRYLITT